MRKLLLRLFTLSGCIALASSLGAQSLALDYAVIVTNSGGDVTQTNSTAIDLTNDLWVSSAYKNAAPPVQATLYFYNLSDGSAASPAFLNYGFDAATSPGILAGFSVAVSDDGVVYTYDHVEPAGGIHKLDNTSDPVTTLLNDIGNGPARFSRNLQVEGTGADTYIISAGAANSPDADLDLWKANDVGVSSVTYQGEIADGGKAGAAMSEIIGGNPPEFIAASDAAGSIYAFRIYQLTGTFPTDTDMGYTLLTQFGQADPSTERLYCVMPAFDTTTPDKEKVVFNLEAGDTDESAAITMYRIRPGVVTEVARVGIPTSTITPTLLSAVRGSLRIDRTNKILYAAYRGATADDTVLAKISYTLPDIPLSARSWDLYE